MIVKNKKRYNKTLLTNGKSINAVPITAKIGDEVIMRTEKTTRNKVLEIADSVLRRIKNDATAASPEDLKALQALQTIDIDLISENIPDLSAELFTDISMDTVTEEMVLRNVIPGIAPFQEISGNSDHFPLMETPNMEGRNIKMQIEGISFKDTLRRELYDTIFGIENVDQAAAIGYIDNRNANFFKPLSTASFGTANQQPADTTGTTLDQRMYNTIQSGLKKLYGLKHPITQKPIGNISGTNFLICSPVDALRYLRL